MPLLKLYFPEELVNPESFEDILLQINKDPAANFKSLDEWMRTLVRNYTVASITSLRRWENTRYISTVGGSPVHVPTLDFWEGDVEGLDDGEEGQLVCLPLGKLQYDYLKTTTKWENTYQREILASGIEHKSVAALVRHILLNSLFQAKAMVDDEKLKEEEREILKEQENQEPEFDPDHPLAEEPGS